MTYKIPEDWVVATGILKFEKLVVRSLHIHFTFRSSNR